MAVQPVKKVRKPRKQKVRQGHKLVWFTLIIILVPIAIVGYMLLTSMEESGKPVEGSRFTSNDLNPRIQESVMNTLSNELMNIEGVESATVNMQSATLRCHINMQDGLDEGAIENAANQAYEVVNGVLPIDTYFTNTEGSKNYDLEIDAYNFLVDDSHPQDSQIYIKITKTGAGTKVVDNLTKARNQELTDSIRRESE